MNTASKIALVTGATRGIGRETVRQLAEAGVHTLLAGRSRDKAVEAAVKARLDEAIAPKGAEAGKTYYGTGHLAQIADFAEAVRDRRAPYVTAESAADTLGTVFDIYDSARLQNYR